MLLSPKAKGTSVGFLLGWVVGIIVAVTVFTLLSSVLPERCGRVEADPGVDPDHPRSGLLSSRSGSGARARPGESRCCPKWMSAIDTMTASGLGLGFLLAAVNPKNLLMAAAAGVGIGEAGLASGAIGVAIVVFT